MSWQWSQRFFSEDWQQASEGWLASWQDRPATNWQEPAPASAEATSSADPVVRTYVEALPLPVQPDAAPQPVPPQLTVAFSDTEPPAAVDWPNKYTFFQLEEWSGYILRAIRHTGATASLQHPCNGERLDRGQHGEPMCWTTLKAALTFMGHTVPFDAIPHVILYQAQTRDQRLRWANRSVPGLAQWKVEATRPRRERRAARHLR